MHREDWTLRGCCAVTQGFLNSHAPSASHTLWTGFLKSGMWWDQQSLLSLWWASKGAETTCSNILATLRGYTSSPPFLIFHVKLEAAWKQGNYKQKQSEQSTYIFNLWTAVSVKPPFRQHLASMPKCSMWKKPSVIFCICVKWPWSAINWLLTSFHPPPKFFHHFHFISFLLYTDPPIRFVSFLAQQAPPGLT